MTAALRRYGIPAAAISSAADLRDAIDAHAPQLIFLDAALERSDAVDAMRVLGDIRYKGKVQLMSGRAAPVIEELRRIGEGRGLAMCPVLSKPFRVGQLVAALAAAGFSPDLGAELFPVDGATDPGWLSFQYRPQLDPRDGVRAGWNGELHLSPPYAEAASLAAFTGRSAVPGDGALISRLTRKAARQIAEMAGVDAPAFATIRMSLSRLRDLPIAAVIRDAGLRETDACPIKIEIPSDELVGDPALAEEVVLQLRLHGVPAVACDVGATYLSFVGHRRLSVIEARLSPKFVVGCGLPQNRLKTEKIIDILHRAGSTVLADGVTERVDLDFLGLAGCDRAQGPIVGPFVESSHAGPLAPIAAGGLDHWVAKFYDV
jgi:EAL domain-containing protein (putative c-di-GMP-specific phosphodiesterase class I)/CheY-like chemotaxis protein